MKDIVIPYLPNASGELQICKKLITKNVPHRNIHVIEGKSRHASHIDQILKLKWAIENLDITDEFYLYNDDFFVIKPIKNTPYYHRGTLNDQIAARPRGYYSNALRTTRELLDDGALSYELHIPFLFNKYRLYALIGSLESNISEGRCPLIRSFYGNAFRVGGNYMADVKNIKDYEDKTYLSTTERTFRRDIGDYIRSKV